MAKDRWPELCRRVEQDDGLPVRDGVGPWTEDKLFFWNRYVDITTSAMVDHPKWPEGLVYVDLFGGPGICVLSDSKRRIPGSPLIAAHATKPFRKILVCERDPTLAEACEKRLAATKVHENCHVFRGDCNDRIDDIVAAIPPRALTLAFIDPTGLHASFETVAKLSRCGRVDMLILFADGHDIVRNVEIYEEQGADSNLDRFLGPDSCWREHWCNLTLRTAPRIRDMFADLYKAQLCRYLHYRVFGEETMKFRGRAIYRLIYASKHERGLEFWEKISKKDASGQTRFC
ncbi:MAG: three-Cys-motif partner protein TcmP [Pirellulales bacterium]|nr:three-Cys-motif partner protein TcmP [Pirellulales bacterium]